MWKTAEEAMTEFSEYLSRVIKRRGLKCVQVAELCNMDTSVVFRWMNGRVLPKSWERLEMVIEKLRLTSDEISNLKNAYRRQVLGVDRSRCFDEIMETLHILEKKQKKHATYMQKEKSLIYEMRFRGTANAEKEFLIMESKVDVWQCIQNLLEMLSVKMSKRLSLKLHTLPEILLMQLKQFANKMPDIRVDVLICGNSRTGDIKIEKLKRMKEMTGLLTQENQGKIFCCNIWDTEEVQENWIVAEDFFMQFSDDMSQGMLTRDAEWIAFFQESFDQMEERYEPLYSKKIGWAEYIQREQAGKYDKTAILGYMPCIGHVLTEQQTFVGDGIDHIPQGMQLLSCFNREGLLEFLEKGYVEIIPDPMYKPLDLQQRCELLERVISLAEQKAAVRYIMLKEDVLDMKGICVKLRCGIEESLCMEIMKEMIKNHNE